MSLRLALALYAPKFIQYLSAPIGLAILIIAELDERAEKKQNLTQQQQRQMLIDLGLVKE